MLIPQWLCMPLASRPGVPELPGPSLLSHWSSWSRGQGQKSGHAVGSQAAGEESSTFERGHWQCKPILMEICLSVCHRAWSRALTGFQAVPLRALRGLLVLEGRVWPFPPVSETCPASLRNKLLLKALASKEPSPTKMSAEPQGDPVPLQPGTQQRRPV